MNQNDPQMRLDDLDAQIRAALEAEPSPEQIARLQQFWRQQSQAERRRRLVRPAALLAAAILIAVTISVSSLRREPSAHSGKPDRATRTAPAAPESNHAAPSRQATAGVMPPEKKTLSASRPPTTYERFFFAASCSKTAAADRSLSIASIDAVLEQLVSDPAADSRQLIESSGLKGGDVELLLLRRLPGSSEATTRAILQLLAVCGTPRSTACLLRLSQSDAFCTGALATIERIAGVRQLAEAARQATDRRVRTAIYRRLFTAGSEAALDAYLALVRDDTTRAEALAVANAVSEPLLPMLLSRLDDKDEAVRLPAALVLGHANGPDVTRALIARVTDEPSKSKEAWIALMACRGKSAESFLVYAASRPQLLGQVNRARMWWVRMSL